MRVAPHLDDARGSVLCHQGSRHQQPTNTLEPIRAVTPGPLQVDIAKLWQFRAIPGGFPFRT